MSYAEMHQVYDDPATRQRAIMCIKEQAQVFAQNPAVDISSLGAAVMRNQWQDIDAVWSAVSTGPNYLTLTDDLSLLSAVQSVWPSVANVLYGHLIFDEGTPLVRNAG